MALSVFGAAFQALFQNALVYPGLLRVLAGASCGAALAMLIDDSWIVIQASAFPGGNISMR